MTNDQKFLREIRDNALKTLKDYPSTAKTWWPYKHLRLLKMLEDERVGKLLCQCNSWDVEGARATARKELYGDD
jgi:hypothetical protein